LELNLLWQSPLRQIAGLVSNAGGWVSTNFSLCAATTNLSLFTNYTALLPQDANDPASPTNYGYALITNVANMLHVGGMLSDGTKFTSFVEPINEQNQFPVYASLYSNAGLLLGELSLDDSTNALVPAGGLLWFKPNQKTGLYTNGFNTVLDVAGSPWTNSAAALAAFNSETQLTFAGGGLASNLVCTVQLTSSNTLRWISGSTNFTSGSLNRANGLMTLAFRDTSGRKVTAYGTILQNLGFGGGFFSLLNATNAGAITLGIQPQ
jgi:hypothetical protein